MCMIDDCDSFTAVWQKKIHRASKPWQCDECGREIATGERYERFQGLDATDRYWWTCRTCEHCLAAREWLTEVCGGFVYSGVREDLENHWDEDVLYRTLSLGRVLIGIRSRWRRKGELMPVPNWEGALMTREAA